MARKLETPGTAANPEVDPAAADEVVDPTDLAAVVARQAKQIELLMAGMQQMQANAGKPVASMPVEVKHPTLEELGDLSKITAPTMTDKGLYVPPTYGANPNGNKG